MAGSHEVRGSIPLGSTTDPRGARRRRRAPLFLLLGPIGRKGLIGQKVCLIQGRRRGPAPLSRSPGLAGPIQAPGRKRASSSRMGIARPGRSRAPAPRARRPRRTCTGASRQSKTGRGRIRRWAAWAPRGSGTRDCPREKRLAGRRGSAVGSDAPSSPAISEAPSQSARRRLIYECFCQG